MILQKKKTIVLKVGLYINDLARRGGVEVAGWTVDRKTWVQFPAYTYCMWAL